MIVASHAKSLTVLAFLGTGAQCILEFCAVHSAGSRIPANKHRKLEKFHTARLTRIFMMYHLKESRK